MPPSRLPRRLILVLAVAAAVLAAVVGVGLYGLLLAPRSAPTTASDVPHEAPGPAPAIPTPTDTISSLPGIRSTSDAEGFTRAVAEALFAWDTASDFEPTDYAQVIVDVGDPSGNEAAGLASDVRSYLPTAEAWAQLRTMQVRQWLTIDEAYVPDSWADALDQAAPGQLLPGTIAYTISGTRHRDGISGTEPVESARGAAFTVFVTCQPTFDTCHVLRLSQLDNPLR
ncbi:MAG: hypothetical protein KF739_00615 [Cryobacterium sp.]|nr:hypothetical protein [Micrococcales bacterium]MBX3308920.1 hypothetical protein [Cryobacterium sp.]